MPDRRKAFTVAALLTLPVAAHAQQGGMQNMPGMTMQGRGTTGGTTGMTNMQSMMSHCADMRRQMAQGTMTSGPDMADMKSQCDQMDRQRGNMPGMGAQAPAGTRSR